MSAIAEVPLGDYVITIGENCFSRLGQSLCLDDYSKIAVITDENVAVHWLESLKSSLQREVVTITLPAGEEWKTIETVSSAWQQLLDAGFDRKSLVLNLGGGVIGDLGGFVASSFMRGIDFYQIPTTLLSQVDASVGGKVGVNFGAVKNLVGAFNQPRGVLIDIATLRTLPERELRAGYAEVLKHGLIRDAEYFSFVSKQGFDHTSSDSLVPIIRKSCEIKSAIVVEDEREGGVRKILNFGHTIGHAVESLSHETEEPLLHGEAVSIGMVAEAKMSELLGQISMAEIEEIESVLSAAKLPIRMSHNIPRKEIRGKFLSDKKNSFGNVKWSLLESIGRATFDQEVVEGIVEQSLDYVRSS